MKIKNRKYIYTDVMHIFYVSLSSHGKSLLVFLYIELAYRV